MDYTLFLLFNHQITDDQRRDAMESLGVQAIREPPDRLKALWSQIPPDLLEIQGFLQPIMQWLKGASRPGDYVLIQGDFGACYLLVSFALANGLIPVYSTTDRIALEESTPDGVIKLVHHFRHKIFRRYGV